jgi:hypothetical protein
MSLLDWGSLNTTFLICGINSILCDISQDCGASRGTRAVGNVKLTLPAGIDNKALTSSLGKQGRLTYELVNSLHAS